MISATEAGQSSDRIAQSDGQSRRIQFATIIHMDMIHFAALIHTQRSFCNRPLACDPALCIASATRDYVSELVNND